MRKGGAHAFSGGQAQAGQAQSELRAGICFPHCDCMLSLAEVSGQPLTRGRSACVLGAGCPPAVVEVGVQRTQGNSHGGHLTRQTAGQRPPGIWPGWAPPGCGPGAVFTHLLSLILTTRQVSLRPPPPFRKGRD